jgi:hypothetical protein
MEMAVTVTIKSKQQLINRDGIYMHGKVPKHANLTKILKNMQF